MKIGTPKVRHQVASMLRYQRNHGDLHLYSKGNRNKMAWKLAAKLASDAEIQSRKVLLRCTTRKATSLAAQSYVFWAQIDQYFTQKLNRKG